MKLADGRMVHGAGYCWICGLPKMSIDDRTCRALACETEHARRLAMPRPPLAEAKLEASRKLGDGSGCGACYGCATGRPCVDRPR